jgi:hypothetical protein
LRSAIPLLIFPSSPAALAPPSSLISSTAARRSPERRPRTRTAPADRTRPVRPELVPYPNGRQAGWRVFEKLGPPRQWTGSMRAERAVGFNRNFPGSTAIF